MAKKSVVSEEADFIVYFPSGKAHYGSYEDAVHGVKLHYPEISTIQRWVSNGVKHEDFKQRSGLDVAQIQFDPMCDKWPAKIKGIEYL